MKCFCTALIWILLFAASPLAAQGSRDERSRQNDPVEVLLELRRELHLGREQVATLREIQRRLELENRPLLQEVSAIQRQLRPALVGLGVESDEGGRSPTPSELAVARTALERIQKNNLAAMEEVNAVLTPDQKRKAGVLLQMGERMDRRIDWMRWRRERSPG